MPVRATIVIAFIAAAGAAFALGRATAPSRVPSRGSDRPAPPSTAVSPVVPAGRTAATGEAVPHLGDADVRRIRDEVVAALALQRAARAEPAEPPTPAPPSPEQALAIAAGDHLIDSALASREWTDADAAALRAQFPAMSIDARVAAARRLAVAVNAGQVQVRASGPLL